MNEPLWMKEKELSNSMRLTSRPGSMSLVLDHGQFQHEANWLFFTESWLHFIQSSPRQPYTSNACTEGDYSQGRPGCPHGSYSPPTQRGDRHFYPVISSTDEGLAICSRSWQKQHLFPQLFKDPESWFVSVGRAGDPPLCSLAMGRPGITCYPMYKLQRAQNSISEQSQFVNECS